MDDDFRRDFHKTKHQLQVMESLFRPETLQFCLPCVLSPIWLRITNKLTKNSDLDLLHPNYMSFVSKSQGINIDQIMHSLPNHTLSTICRKSIFFSLFFKKLWSNNLLTPTLIMHNVPTTGIESPQKERKKFKR